MAIEDRQTEALEGALARALERANQQLREQLDHRIDIFQRYLQTAIEADVKALHKASTDIATIAETLFTSGLVITEGELSRIEAQANEAWVVTLDLYNDTEPGHIKDTVKANLKNGKRYTYFLPDPTTEEGRRSLDRRIQHEREFREYRERITYIDVTGDTFFVSSEVVIHNPPPLFRPDEFWSGTAQAFTYARLEHPGSLYVRVDPAALQAMIRGLQRVALRRAVPSVASGVLREFQDRVGAEAALLLARWLRPAPQFIGDDDISQLASAIAAVNTLDDRERDEILDRFRQLLPVTSRAQIG